MPIDLDKWVPGWRSFRVFVNRDLTAQKFLWKLKSKLANLPARFNAYAIHFTILATMTKMRFVIVGVAMLCSAFFTTQLYGQNSNFGNWLIYFGDVKFKQRFNWHHEVQYRNFNFIGDTEQLLLRTGIGYNLSENNNNLHLGYGFIYSEPYVNGTEEKTRFNEHRIYQQFITRQTFGRLSLQHRYRFEQRFFEDDFRLRLRYFLSANIALNRKQMEDKTLYLSVYNEIFINTANVIFDRNRIYGGLGYRFSKHVRTELGVMNQSTNSVSRNQLNVITFLNF